MQPGTKLTLPGQRAIQAQFARSIGTRPTLERWQVAWAPLGARMPGDLLPGREPPVKSILRTVFLLNCRSRAPPMAGVLPALGFAMQLQKTGAGGAPTLHKRRSGLVLHRGKPGMGEYGDPDGRYCRLGQRYLSRDAAVHCRLSGYSR